MHRAFDSGKLLPKDCLYCNKEILFGRTDKRFCNDTCRNNYNREIRARKTFVEPAVKEIFRVIQKNYDILNSVTMKFNFSLPHVVSRQFLIDNNFHFKFFTSIRKQSDGSIYCFCFEYGWKELPDHKVMLIINYDQTYI